MIYIIIFFGFIDIHQELKNGMKDYHTALELRRDFGLVIQGKGFLPNVDMDAAESTYLSSPGNNPYIYFALGDLYRYKKYKEKEKRYFEMAIEKSTSYGELFILDRLFSKKRLWEFSELTRKKIIQKSDAPFYTLSLLYQYEGVKSINKGFKKEGIRDLKFSGKIDPGNRAIPLMLIRAHFPKIKSAIKYIFAYLLTFKSFRNQVFLMHALCRYFILFIFLLSLYYIIALFFKKFPIITRFISSRFPIHHWWLVSILILIILWLYPLYGIIFSLLIISPIISKREFISISIILLLFSSISLFSLLDTKILNGVKSTSPMRNLIYLQEVLPETQMVQNARMENLEYYCTMGNLYYPIDSKIALSFYFRGLKKFGNNPVLLNNIGCVYAKTGREDSAFYWFNLAKKINPTSPIPHLNLSNLYIKNLKFREAEEERNIAQKYNSEITGNVNPDTLFLMKVPNGDMLKTLLHSSEMPEKIFTFPPFLLLIMGMSCILVIAILKKFLKFTNFESCLVCGGWVEGAKTIEDNKVCNYCYHRLTQTNSKGIRERFKKLIQRNIQIRMRIKAHILNIFLPGAGFMLIGDGKRSIFITLITSYLIIAFFYPYTLYGPPGFSIIPPMGKMILEFIIFILYLYEFLILEREVRKWH